MNEAFIGPNGSVDNRMYTYSTSFTDGKQINAVDLPFMNGSQFMVCMWVRELFFLLIRSLSAKGEMADE